MRAKKIVEIPANVTYTNQVVTIAQAKEIPVVEIARDHTSTSSLQFAYDLVDALKVKNSKTIKRLIRCESNGENVTRPDNNGRLSRGILQFNDGGTWEEMSLLSGISGSPEKPRDAILMADWMIKHGYLNRWSCAYITGMLRR